VNDVQAARRICVAMITAASQPGGEYLSIKRFLDFAEDAGITDDEALLRLAIRVAWFNAAVAGKFLGILNLFGIAPDEVTGAFGLRVAESDPDD
jgi:hypothetical protein